MGHVLQIKFRLCCVRALLGRGDFEIWWTKFLSVNMSDSIVTEKSRVNDHTSLLITKKMESRGPQDSSFKSSSAFISIPTSSSPAIFDQIFEHGEAFVELCAPQLLPHWRGGAAEEEQARPPADILPEAGLVGPKQLRRSPLAGGPLYVPPRVEPAHLHAGGAARGNAGVLRSQLPRRRRLRARVQGLPRRPGAAAADAAGSRREASRLGRRAGAQGMAGERTQNYSLSLTRLIN